MAFTKGTRNDLFDDLTEYTGWVIEPVEIHREPRRHEEIAKPAIVLLPGAGGEVDLETFSHNTSEATLRFPLLLIVASATPGDDLADFIDDVRNAVQRSDGKLRARSGGLCLVETWGETLTDADSAGGVYFQQVMVRADVRYVDGAA